MPRFASRITLEITKIRIQRVQDISRCDAEAEGVELIHYKFARDEFAVLWDYINDKRGYGWAFNPWVWVIEFKRVVK
jgi:hypothetical protein